MAGARWTYLAAALLLTSSTMALRSLRWRILLNAEARLSVRTVFWANMVGYLGNNFLPARAGEVIRSFLISSCSTLSRAYVLTTALSERLMDVIALVLWSSLLTMGMNTIPGWLAGVSRSMAVAAGAGALAMALLPHTGSLPEQLVERFFQPGRLRDRVLRLARETLLGLRALHDWRRFGAFVLMTAIIWTLDACCAMVSGIALGLHIRFAVALLLLTGLGLGSALPSTPGYVGVFQFVAVTVLTPFGITREAALAYILVAQALGFAAVLAFGIPGLYQFQIRAAKAAAGN